MTPSPYAIAPDRSLREADTLMREHQIRHLPVIDGERLVGLVSQRDLRLLIALSEVPSESIRVDAAMWEAPFSVAPATPLEEAVRSMAEKKFGAAVVVDQGRVVGAFTTIDALALLAALLHRNERKGESRG